MDTGPLKTFAMRARADVIKEVGARLDVVLAPGSDARLEYPRQVEVLERLVAKGGRESLVERAAYTWFNRIVALRFMDANGYTGVGVVSPEAGQDSGQPEVLANAKAGTYDSSIVPDKTVAEVGALISGSRPSPDPQGEAYGLLLEAYCHHWHQHMDFMFEKEADYTDLLVPASLLSADSVRDRAVKVLTKEVCQDVEVIGWLYQFYISDRKDEVFAGFKKNKKAGAEEIPAATQLFTPHWIVRYLVENSLGRLWMLNRPSSRLVDQMDYFIPPVDEETDFLKITKPEELKLVDPACGSGHLLTYAFDLLYLIYEDEGYAPSEIPSLILANNLFGMEIDPRAASLAAFALAMKARARQRTFFSQPLSPNICALENVSFTPTELDYLWSMVTGSGVRRGDTDAFWCALERADTYGSLIVPNASLLGSFRESVESAVPGDLFAELTLAKARRVLSQAEYLTGRYHVLIANPPYMGSGNMGALLSEFVREKYPKDKQDLYACFVERAYQLTRRESMIGMIVGDTWMTLSTFENFRTRLLDEGGLVSCLHLDDVSNHPDIFGANTAFVLERGSRVNLHCAFVHLEPLGSEKKRIQLLSAISDPQSPLIYRVSTNDFRAVPGSAFAYRMGGAVRDVFSRFPALGSKADARQGLSPGDTARFVRFWYEVSDGKSGFAMSDVEAERNSGRKWFPFNKGGPFRRWYGNVEHVINWQDGGRELMEFRPRSVIRNPQYYFQPAVTWSSVSSGESAFRWVDPGVIFSDVGQSIFSDDASTRKSLLAILNSRFGSDLLALLAPNLHFQAGIIAKVPVSAELDPGHLALVEELVEIMRHDWNTQESAYAFERPDWIGDASEESLNAVLCRRSRFWTETTRRVLEAESIIDDMVERAYGLAGANQERRPRSRASLVNNALFGIPESGELEADRQYLRRCVADLMSYAVGCMLGRYSLDQPGLILADQGATLQDYFAKVPDPAFVPDADNVIPIVDGDWFEDDIVERFRVFLKAAFGEECFEENLAFVTESLGVKTLRDYFVKSFYKDHVQRYKKRPIYWLFSSPKGSFNALVYLHRYTPTTVSTVLNEYLRAYQTKLDVRLTFLEGQIAGAATAKEVAQASKEAEKIRAVLVELKAYETDLYQLAQQQIALDLDDGVKVNYGKFGTALKDIGINKGNSND